MKQWEVLDRAPGPDGAELILYRREDEFVIRVDGYELMSSRAHGSEEAMAELACRSCGSIEHARVLVGGLGLGYTLRAALNRLGRGATVVVAEIVPAVVAWNHGPLGPLAGHPLRDPRVILKVADVGLVLREAKEPFDAILFDVDNGPKALTARSNEWLYGRPGLARARRALKLKGVLAVWSASADSTFESRLCQSGFTVTKEEVPAYGRARRPRYTIYVARQARP